MLLKTRAVVLRRRVFGESDALVTLFSPEEGRFSAIVKGMRKAKVRRSGGCDQFVLGSFLLRRGRSLALVEQVEIERSFYGLRHSLLALAVATYLTELVERITVEHEPQPALFELLCLALSVLEERKADPFLLRRFFELHALRWTGYAPELDRCVRCGQEVEGSCWASPAAGGILCAACGPPGSDAFPLSGGARAYLLRLRSHPPQAWGHLRLSEVAERELDRFFRAYFLYHFETEPRSADFLRQLWEQRVLGSSGQGVKP